MRFGYEQLPISDSTPIWLDNLVCSGDEKSLVDCRHNGIGIHNCDHDQDAGLVCSEGIIYLATWLECLWIAISTLAREGRGLITNHCVHFHFDGVITNFK